MPTEAISVVSALGLSPFSRFGHFSERFHRVCRWFPLFLFAALVIWFSVSPSGCLFVGWNPGDFAVLLCGFLNGRVLIAMSLRGGLLFCARVQIVCRKCSRSRTFRTGEDALFCVAVVYLLLFYFATQFSSYFF